MPSVNAETAASETLPRKSGPLKTGPLSPWLLVFVALAVLLSFVVGVGVRFATGISDALWPVFCANVAVAGLLADWLLRRFCRVAVLAWRAPPLPISFFWAGLFALLGVLGPEGFRTSVDSVFSIILSIKTIFHAG